MYEVDVKGQSPFGQRRKQTIRCAFSDVMLTLPLCRNPLWGVHLSPVAWAYDHHLHAMALPSTIHILRAGRLSFFVGNSVTTSKPQLSL